MRVSIKDIAYELPDAVLTNDELGRENPEWDMARVEKRAGVRCRHIAADGETALDLGMKACEKLFAANPTLKESVDALLFCTESPDHIIPPNACIMQGKLDLAEDVFALDVDLGCSGFPHTVALAQGLIVSGIASNVLVVTGDTYSKYIHKGDRSSRVLFGDGVAASWISECDDDSGIIDIQCAVAGKFYDKFIIPAGGCRFPVAEESAESGPPPECIFMDGMGILSFVGTKIPKHVKSLLERNNLTVDQVDLFIFHQASQMVLDTLTRMLKIKPEQTFSNLPDIGNTVSASIPIALKDALDMGRISSGNTLVLCGFGLGLSWGSLVIRWP